jgi:hypothetical protein
MWRGDSSLPKAQRCKHLPSKAFLANLCSPRPPVTASPWAPKRTVRESRPIRKDRRRPINDVRRFLLREQQTQRDSLAFY